MRHVYDDVQPDFVIALHEGPQSGTFMFTNRFVGPTLGRALCDGLAAGGTRLAERDYFGIPLEPAGLSPATPVTRAVWRLWASAFRQQATIVYSEARGVPEIVLESSWWHPDEAARVRPHVHLVRAVAQHLA